MEKKRPRSGSPMTRNRSNSSLPTTQDEGRLMQAMEASSRRRGPARTYASRFRKLHGELKRVVERHEQGQPSGMWARRLWQACSLGAALQLTVVVLLCLEGGEGGRFLVSVGDALAVLAALVLLVVLQQAQLTRADTMIISRARRFLNRLMSFASDEEFASRETLAEHARARSVWLQTTRSISTVPVFDNLGVAKSIPSQLLVHGDRIMTPPDLWLVRGYCEESCEGADRDSIVQDTPAAVQFQQVLGQNRRPENLFDRQARMVNAAAAWLLAASLLLSGAFSVWGAITIAMHNAAEEEPPHRSASAFNLLALSHTAVVLPLLPLTIYLIPALLKAVCNAYIAAFIEAVNDPEQQSRARDAPPRSSALWRPLQRWDALSRTLPTIRSPARPWLSCWALRAQAGRGSLLPVLAAAAQAAPRAPRGRAGRGGRFSDAQRGLARDWKRRRRGLARRAPRAGAAEPALGALPAAPVAPCPGPVRGAGRRPALPVPRPRRKLRQRNGSRPSRAPRPAPRTTRLAPQLAGRGSRECSARGRPGASCGGGARAR